MLFNSFKKKLIFTLIILSSIPIIILGIVIHLTMKDQIIDQAIDAKTQFIVNKAEDINMWFYKKEKDLESIANDEILYNIVMNTNSNFLEISKYLLSLVENSESFLNLYITMEDGREYNSALLTDEIDTRIRQWYKDTVKANDIIWTQPYKDILTGEIVMTVSLPIRDGTGKIQGVLGADISIEKILSEIDRIVIADDFTTYIIDSYGKIISYFGENILQIDETVENLRLEIEKLIKSNISNNKSDLKLIKLDEKEYFVINSFIPEVKWEFVCIFEKDIFYKNIINIRKIISFTLFITLFIVILLALFLSNQFSKPLQELKKGTIELYKGNYNYRISIYKNDEFGQLAKAFNKTAEELSKSYKKKINKQTMLLVENNKQLQDMNIELKASYEQLQAITLELNESEQKYRLLVENMHDLVWAIDSNYRITFVNDQIKDMLKYDKEEVIGTDIRDLLSKILYFNSEEGKSDNLNSNFEKLMGSDYKSVQVVLISKNGKEVIGEVRTRRIFDKGELIGVHGVLRDITERKELYSQIIRKNKELSTINKISKNLNSTMDINKLLKMVVDDIVDLMKIPLCTIRLLTEDDKLKLMAYSGELTDIIWFDEIPIDEDVLGKAVRKGEIIKFINFAEENISKYNKKIIKSGKFDCINVIPLIARERVLGVFTVATKKELDESQTTILISVANQVAMIIENINLYYGLKESYLRTIKTLAAAVEAKDKYTEGHSNRVSKYSYLIAKHMGLPNKICDEVEIGGILHDIGKIGIKDSILSKPGKLTDEEFNEIKRHPTIGDRILQNVGFSDIVMNAIKYHHKRYDLKGYPEGNKLEELPLEACIVGVADALDAMASNRSYRKAMSIEDAIKEIIRNKGTQFHPEVVDTLVDIYRKNPETIIEISKFYCD